MDAYRECTWWGYVAYSGPFYEHGLILIPAWMSHCIHYKMWEEINHASSTSTVQPLESRNGWQGGNYEHNITVNSAINYVHDSRTSFWLRSVLWLGIYWVYQYPSGRLAPLLLIIASVAEKPPSIIWAHIITWFQEEFILLQIESRHRFNRTKHRSLQWRCNERHGVSNHLHLDCLLNRLFRRTSKETSKVRVTSLCEGIHRWQVDSPHKEPVTWNMFPFDDVFICTWWHCVTRILFGEYDKINENAVHLAFFFAALRFVITWIISYRSFWSIYRYFFMIASLTPVKANEYSRPWTWILIFQHFRKITLMII